MFANAQDPWAFAGQFPQFRDMSGFPGGMFGVTSEGKPSIQGALAISTPIGFSLGNLVFDLGIDSISRDNRPAFYNNNVSTNTVANSGTGQIMGGFRTPIGNLTVAGEVLSSRFDNTLNLQLQLPLNVDQLGVSVGCQNVFDRADAAGDGEAGERDLSRSVFVVATYEVSTGTFVSFGKGDVRFRGVFGSACANITPRLKAVGENDRFGWNTGLAYSLGKLPIGGALADNEVTLWAGFIQLHRATVAVNWAF